MTHGRGYVYSLQYHIVWVTKYRKPIFTGAIEADVKQYLLETLKSLDMTVLAMEIMPDHIHLLADCKPQLRLSDAIKILKGNTARWLFLSHPEIKKQLWGGHLWNPSYFVATVSDRTLAQAGQYISNQKPDSNRKEVRGMQIYTTYSVKIRHYNHIFKDTVAIYRKAVDYLIGVCDAAWDGLSQTEGSLNQQRYIETLVHATKSNPAPVYDFDSRFYKMPSYLRRGAVNEAVGKVSSYRSNLMNWNSHPAGKAPVMPRAGYVFPSMYRTVMYNQTGTYEAQLKVYVRNTWDWITVDLRKSDMDYITRRCKDRKQCAPALQKRGKEWFLDFPFEEKVKLCDTAVHEQTVAAVDLGINTAATVSVMRSDGTILGRHFCKLPKETDHLAHSINRIKKAQKHGNYRTPRLWAKAKGINHDIASKTANCIMDIAVLYNADVIVFEHLDKKGKVRGSKKQRLKMWRSQEVQAIVTNKAHRMGMRISRICAWGTSKHAYDGSGTVLRGKAAGLDTYSMCRFPNGKVYNCDLSASYNIGARYFIREILKSLPETARLDMEAKVPPCSRRSTCTFSTLISLNAALAYVCIDMSLLSVCCMIGMQSARLKRAGVGRHL